MITGKLYDWLKWLAQIFLPALGTLYFSLAGIWGLPSATEVVGSIMAFDLFLGVILGISQVNYNKRVATGVINIEETRSGDQRYSLELEDDPQKLSDMKEARFKIEEGGE